MTVPVPTRITQALDAPCAPGAGGPLEGPGVDEFCGVEEPTVDRWETGEAVPTEEQLEALAELTGYPVEWFYRPVIELAGGFMCVRGGRGSGCYPLTGELTPDQERRLARAFAPPPPPRPPAPPLPELAPGELPECSGCAAPMRRDVWRRRRGRCSSCGPS